MNSRSADRASESVFVISSPFAPHARMPGRSAHVHVHVHVSAGRALQPAGGADVVGVDPDPTVGAGALVGVRGRTVRPHVRAA